LLCRHLCLLVGNQFPAIRQLVIILLASLAIKNRLCPTRSEHCYGLCVTDFALDLLMLWMNSVNLGVRGAKTTQR
jgi:hypothetical protein